MLALALAFNLLVFLLACVGMMTAFLGGAGLAALLVLLGLSLPVTAIMSAGGLAWFVRRHGFPKGFRAAWHALPQWLAIAAWLAVALIFCGELALIVTLQLAETPPALWQHLPLLAGLGAVVGYCVIHAMKAVRAEA